ncbi:MAG: hypothetical protein A2901_04720 [Elusimicrobia bacterium RIFCSPLOWO2_01_FULL_54_10]|nr:MAG: hypothetical protein A2901_04720 [Elusimicrobia bacterium RIFCSPLOWO2_01_FULL_54_10]
MPDEDAAYLRALAADTYRCISFMAHPKTGVPLDNSKHDAGHHTSVTNIGFYLASIVGAVELGLETRASAFKKIDFLLSLLSRLETWKNFPVNWYDAGRLTPNSDNLVSTVDLGNYYAGIIVVRQAFPELEVACDRLLRTDWNMLYDSEQKLLYGGYNLKMQASTEWHYDHLGADSRLAGFLAVAIGRVPKESWDALNRNLEQRYGVEYLKPGWEAGGLFLGYMSGIFIDEKGFLPGLSAANFAKAQMIHQDKIHSPVWGWSASDSPKDGYLGFLALKDDIVAPYASAMAVEDFPGEVIANLKMLERLGARTSHLRSGKYVPFGFRDAYDIRTRAITSNYLMLDQTMIFLTLVNALKDRAISRHFESYAPVLETKKLLSDYASRVIVDPASYPLNLGRHFNLKVIPYESERPEYRVVRAAEIPLLHVQEWERAEIISLTARNLEAGELKGTDDLGARAAFLWDDQYLYVRAQVKDQSIRPMGFAPDLYKGDLVEVYINPDSRGLTWGSTKDYQLGIAPAVEGGDTLSYLWFQDRRPFYDDVRAISRRTEDGYEITAAVSWKLLRMETPVRGQSLGVSLAVNDVDAGEPQNAKVNWFFQPREGKFLLPKVILN